jgi:hypothetical protein
MPNHHGREGLTNILVVGGVDIEKTARHQAATRSKGNYSVGCACERRVALRERVSEWKET